MKKHTFSKIFFLLMFALKSTGNLHCSWFLVWLPLILIPIFVALSVLADMLKEYEREQKTKAAMKMTFDKMIKDLKDAAKAHETRPAETR